MRICHGLSRCYKDPIMMDSIAKEVSVYDDALGEILYG